MISTAVTTLLFAAILQVFMPWWSILIAAGVAGFISPTTPVRTFWAAAIAIAGLWTGFMLSVSIMGSVVLLPKLAELFSLPHYILLYPITMLLGALPAGLAALSGTYLRQFVKPRLY